MNDTVTAYRTCPLCEATCGLELTIEAGQVSRIRGDAQDVFSHGFVCPKGAALKPLHEDPDRVRAPLVRTATGFEEVSWDDALGEVERKLTPILERHGRDAVGAYLGNPNAHNLDALLYGRVLLKALGTRNIFSATTVDQMPKHVSAGLMFGAPLSIPIPDVDRTDHLVMLGANPLASNGSLLTAPDMRGRLRAIRERGGHIVVFDPRRSRTAEEADEHHFIRPGTDAHLLFAIVHVLFEEGLADPGPLAEHCAGLDDLQRARRRLRARDREPRCAGSPSGEIRRVARELAAAERAAVYGRIGTCTQEFGTLASWLVDVVNVLTGNLDRPGGAMFTRAAAGAANTRGTPGKGKGFQIGRWHTRVRGLPEALGEFPVACLAEEIDTPGEGQIRALFTFAGNPAVSTPNSGRLAHALDSLELMVSLDIYVNETTRHADVILPAPSALHRSHYDVALYQLAARNVANYSPAILGPDPAVPPEWHTLLRLTGIAAGQGADADVDAFDDFVIGSLMQRDLQDPASPLAGRDAGGAAGRAGSAARAGADARLDAPQRSLRRPLRGEPGRPHAGTAGGGTARDRPGAAGVADPRGPEDAEREDRAGTGADRRRRRAADGIACGPPQRRDGADRPPAAALEQLVDAQRPATWCAARTAARPTSIPTTPRVSGSRTAAGSPWPPSAARSRCRSR